MQAINSTNGGGLLNYATERTIRRVKDLEEELGIGGTTMNGERGNFKLDMDGNSDDLLRQFKNNLT
jgi:hypothetical protein